MTASPIVTSAAQAGGAADSPPRRPPDRPDQGRLEVRAFFRERQTVVFVFALPAILLVLLGSIFGHDAALRGVTVGQLFTAGMIAGGIGATSFQNLGLTIAAERERGTLKRLRGTPMSPACLLHRQDHSGLRLHDRRSPRAHRGRDGLLSPALADVGGQVVDTGLGLRPGHHRLLADRHRHQQPVRVRRPTHSR